MLHLQYYLNINSFIGWVWLSQTPWGELLEHFFRPILQLQLDVVLVSNYVEFCIFNNRIKMVHLQYCIDIKRLDINSFIGWVRLALCSLYRTIALLNSIHSLNIRGFWERGYSLLYEPGNVVVFNN